MVYPEASRWGAPDAALAPLYDDVYRVGIEMARWRDAEMQAYNVRYELLNDLRLSNRPTSRVH
ncbi:unnamed protein product [Spodoptera exigua]|nr:unnamed protein product [Spodoptera exigua]